MASKIKRARLFRRKGEKSGENPGEDVSGATPERLHKAQGFVEIGGERGAVRITTMRDSPIERALARGAVSEKQYAAAIKFRHHWFHGGLAGAISSMDLNRIFASDLTSFSQMARSEGQAHHRGQFRAAVETVGLTAAGVLVTVVCNEIALEHAGYKLGWGHKPQAIVAATERMRGALDDLVKMWGI